MTTMHPTRFAQALVLSTAVAVLVLLPTVAIGGSGTGQRVTHTVHRGNSAGQTGDWFERYAKAHPYGVGVPGSTQAPDWFERYTATHPFGKGVLGTTQALAVDGTHRIEAIRPDGFDWSDAGVGAGIGAAAIALLGCSILVLLTHRRNRLQAT
ncbi:MAG: hypothetical protein E6G14_12160 [Actinobacteria bacterium]|nr:MAG: hypothetical protein E6G60_13240 [Actinomycetota bacterium]TML67562.1 MAG: hypothetical protein E6G14_12160 [Actinomycetota bacterium]